MLNQNAYLLIAIRDKKKPIIHNLSIYTALPQCCNLTDNMSHAFTHIFFYAFYLDLDLD